MSNYKFSLLFQNKESFFAAVRYLKENQYSYKVIKISNNDCEQYAILVET